MKLPDGVEWSKLKSFTLFLDLTEGELKEFLDGSRTNHYPEGGSILKQGDPPQGLGILLSGKAKVYRIGEHNAEHFLSVLKEGDFFGEMALVSPGVRSASIDAIESCEVAWVSADQFKSFVSGASPLIAKILSRMVMDLSNRLRMLDERYVFMKEHMQRRG
jgi:CRP-like cAMP-binding protein